MVLPVGVPDNHLSNRLAERADARRFRVGSVAAVGLHALLLLTAAQPPERLFENMKPLRTAPELIDAPEPIENEPAGASGGGTPEPTEEQPAAPSPKLRAPTAQPPEPTDHADTIPAPDVIAAAPDAISRATLRAAKPMAVPGNSRDAQRFGSGSGSGVGSGHGGLFGSGRHLGNGPGALKAKICRIPDTTRALRQITECSAIYEQFMDEINVPPQRFEGGLPGFEDLTEYFAVDISGTFKVNESGSYRFKLKSDDGSQLFIDGQLVIDHDGVHGATAKKGDIDLSAGRHGIHVRYFQAMKYELALQLYMTPPGGTERLFNTGF